MDYRSENHAISTHSWHLIAPLPKIPYNRFYKLCLWQGTLLSHWNKAPGESPLLDRYSINAETGHKSSPVLPSITHTPTAPWSVLERLMFREITFGDSALSTVMSLKDKWSCGSYSFSFSIVISPDLQKEKKVVREAAQSITELWDWCWPIQIGRIFFSINCVIGRHVRGAFPAFLRSIFTPLNNDAGVASD